MQLTDLVSRVVLAAQAGDMETVRRLIDWPLSAAAAVVTALSRLPEAARAKLAAEGLAELTTAASPDATEDVLGQRADYLVRADGSEPASPRERSTALAALLVPPTPPGLTAEQAATLAGLRQRSRLLSEVRMVTGPRYRHPYVLAPDSGQLVIVLD